MGVLDIIEDLLHKILVVCRSESLVETRSLAGADLNGKEVLANFLMAVFPTAVFSNPDGHKELVQAAEVFAEEFEAMVNLLASDGVQAMHSSPALMTRFMVAYEKVWVQFKAWKQSMTCVALTFHLGKLKDLVDAVDMEIKGTPFTTIR